MPSSSTATRCDAPRRSSVSGRPTRLFCVPRVRSTRVGAERLRAGSPPSISLVVVLPLLPVTATHAGRRRRRRWYAARSPSAARRLAHRPPRVHGRMVAAVRSTARSTITAPAPRLAASSTMSRARRAARPADRDEQLAGLDGAGVGGDARESAVGTEVTQLAAASRPALRPARSARAPPDGSASALTPAPPERAAHLFAIVEVALLGADDLVVLVPLARRRARRRRDARAAIASAIAAGRSASTR